MRRVVVVSIAVCATVVGWVGDSSAQSSQALFKQVSDYHFFTVRRHNDVQGVEGVFDDYRKNWLRRQNSGVLVGNDSLGALSDTPVCGDTDLATRDPDRAKFCGNGHVMRASSTTLAARFAGNGANIREWGNLSYVGYERLISNDVFLGAGLSGAGSRVENRVGSGLRVDNGEVAGHLLGGYRVNSTNMVVWNVTAVRSFADPWRPENFIGRFENNSIFATGTWYSNFQLTRSAYVSLGLDYTLQFTSNNKLTVSDGTSYLSRKHTGSEWQGDFTGSALFVQPLDRAELFARIGLTASGLNKDYSELSVPVDVGGAWRVTNKIALTGAVGGTYMASYSELRGKLHLTGRY